MRSTHCDSQHEPPIQHDVGGGKLIAWIKDANNNRIGLLESAAGTSGAPRGT